MFKKPAAMIMAFVLAASLCPAAAYANEGSAELAAGASTLQAQASTKAIWVRTQWAHSNSSMPPTTYKYDKNGLLTATSYWQWTNTNASGRIKTTIKRKYDSAGNMTRIYTPNYTTTFKYDSNGRITSSTFDNGDGARKTTYSYDKNGNLVLVKRLFASGSSSSGDYTYDSWDSYKLTYDKNQRLTKNTHLITYYENGKKWKSDVTKDKTTYSYDTSGNVTKKKLTYVNTFGTHAATGKGYITKSSVDTKTIKFKNTYKSKRLTKRNVSGDIISTPGTYSFKYKKISVPAKYAKLVQQQQRELINPTAMNISDWEYM